MVTWTEPTLIASWYLTECLPTTLVFPQIFRVNLESISPNTLIWLAVKLKISSFLSQSWPFFISELAPNTDSTLQILLYTPLIEDKISSIVIIHSCLLNSQLHSSCSRSFRLNNPTLAGSCKHHIHLHEVPSLVATYLDGVPWLPWNWSWLSTRH